MNIQDKLEKALAARLEAEKTQKVVPDAYVRNKVPFYRPMREWGDELTDPRESHESSNKR